MGRPVRGGRAGGALAWLSSLQLRPVVVALMRLGMELPDVARIVSLWPEVLLASPETTITPFVQYLTAAGCEATQIAAVLGDTPHLLGFPPADVFGPRLAALAGVGIGQEQLAAMMSKSTRPLTARGGVVEQLAWLRAALGLNDEQIKAVVMAQPDILAEKVADLEAKWRFITGRVEGRVSDVLRHPLLLAAPLPTVLGPRWDFAVSKSALPAVSGLEGYDFDALLGCSDLELCETLRCSANEYGGYKARWEESHSESVHADNAAEFQAELKKLGIFEGPPSS